MGDDTFETRPAGARPTRTGPAGEQPSGTGPAGEQPFGTRERPSRARERPFEPWPAFDRTAGETFALRPVIRAATAEDAGAVAELIATAFAGLRSAAYLVPERRQRHRVMTAHFRILVEHALEHGEIHLIDGGPAAVAVWFPHLTPLPAPRDYDRRLEEATGEWAGRFRVLDGLSVQNRPEQAHHHLAFLAVHPDRQNQGLGTTLLHHRHARLGGLPAYLEANDVRNRDLYARHGYEAREPFALPDGTLYWPMWRPGTV